MVTLRFGTPKCSAIIAVSFALGLVFTSMIKFYTLSLKYRVLVSYLYHASKKCFSFPIILMRGEEAKWRGCS
jgi:hypothetical protein